LTDVTNGSAQIQSGTAEGLLQFLDYVVAKGYGPSSAVAPWRSAVRQVLSVVEKTDAIGGVNMRELNLDDYLGRFETLARGDLKVESIHSYRRRFTRALTAYLDFIDNGKPPTFRPERRRARQDNGQAADAPTAERAESAAAPPVPSGDSRMIDYPFPLRSGQVATLRLPVRFEKADAERLAAFVRTLVFEQQRELTRGNGEDEPDE
jgi:hypothetical protein